MKQGNKTTKKKQPDHAPAKPAGMTELTEQDLEQVQGGGNSGVMKFNLFSITKAVDLPSPNLFRDVTP